MRLVVSGIVTLVVAFFTFCMRTPWAYMRLVGVDTVVRLDSDSDTLLDQWLAAPEGNRTVIVATNQTLSRRPTILVSPLKILCENGAVIRVDANAGLIWGGNDGSIEGCTFLGKGTDVPTAPLVESMGNRFVFRRNTVSGFGTTGGNGVVEAILGSHGQVSDNNIAANMEASIFINAPKPFSTLADWTIERNTAQNIVVHTTGASSNIRDFVVSGNDLSAGGGGNIEFCVEIGQFGGSPPTDYKVSGNHCRLTADGVDGGYSMGGVRLSVDQNTFDSQGFGYAVNSYEFVNATDGSVERNQANSGTSGLGFSCGANGGSNQCTRMKFSDNIQKGWGRGPYATGFYFGTSVKGSSISDNRVANNTAIFASGATGRAFWLQCNAAPSTCSNNIFQANKVIGDGTPGAQGIRLENNSGSMTGNIVSQNSLSGLPPDGFLVTVGKLNVTFDDRNGIPLSDMPGVMGDGSAILCSDCMRSTHCARGGAGAVLKRLNGVSVCVAD